MPKSGQKRTEKRPALYYIATVLMIIAALGILYYVWKDVVPFVRANQLEKEIPKPVFNASVQKPVTFSVLSASAVVASPPPKTGEALPGTKVPEPETTPDRPLTKEEERVQAILKEAQLAVTGEDKEHVFEETDAPIDEAFKELLEINPDTVGWLTVGEVADYPVVKRDDNYYLGHNFKRQYDTNGSIFVSQYNVMRPRDTILLIFGHHMPTGQMFGNLWKYGDEEYMRQFPLVQFRTIYADEEEHDSWYVPVSFFSASTIEGEEGYFDVLPMFFETEQAHKTYLDTIQARSLWKQPTDVTTEDKLIVLITCSYDQLNSRYLLICRQLREDETPEEMEALYKREEK